MESLTFLDEHHKTIQLSIFMGVFLVCLNIEYFFGVTEKSLKFKNFRTNLLFIIPGFIFQTLLGFIFMDVLVFENIHNYGFLHYIGITSVVAQLIISFVFLDFFYWLYHFLMHKIAIVWRFHAVHHSDKILNVSTSLREHPMETTIRLSHYMLAVWFLGPFVWIISLHQFVQVVSKIIIHSNWRLPDKIDKYISYLILTPNMHHVHHHEKQPYTDSNYGDLFSVWDRLFGTFYYLSKEDVVFGLDVKEFENINSQNLRFKNLMKIPFKNHLSNK
ncbi:sterol desaturase family protein [Lacihabitans sp. LS3-19]|uniref:sterol desaturase family protein n=1 Tax=Lacihabitans sp. LS3-19 TaxID=2487335 RepID=UPI0020CBF969|nr:sterol desaturase family protein [Lacihabitans sp. LS3-19]MCP9768350.1 sterol desaturase family protein [Lacihabitans sp. LS3-19]